MADDTPSAQAKIIAGLPDEVGTPLSSRVLITTRLRFRAVEQVFDRRSSETSRRAVTDSTPAAPVHQTDDRGNADGAAPCRFATRPVLRTRPGHPGDTPDQRRAWSVFVLFTLRGFAALQPRPHTEFAIDSSGFGSTHYERWYDEKYRITRTRAKWVKAHIACGVKTNIVTAVRVLDVGGMFQRAFHFFQLNQEEYMAKYH